MNDTVLISGASIAGPSLAYWLNRCGFRPTVVEKAGTVRPEGGHRRAARPWSAADLRQGADQSGQARRTERRLAGDPVRAVRRGGGQDDQDVPGDVPTGRRDDPRGDRQGGRRLAAVLQHQPGGDGGGNPGGRGGSGQ